MGGVATTACKRLASLLAAKRDQSYSSVVSWIRCSTSFSVFTEVSYNLLAWSQVSLEQPSDYQST